MFGVVLHPQSVARRRAVAELSMRGARSNTVGMGHVFLVTGSKTQPPPQSRAEGTAAGPERDGLDIVIDYRLGEYLQVLIDFAPIEHRRRARLGGASESDRPKQMTWLMRALLVIVGTAAFSYKVRKVGRCRFKIRSEGVERLSNGGTLRTAWSDVVDVLKLSGAYLIEKPDGAMPIPFRCMNEDERALFERLVGEKGAWSARSGTRPARQLGLP